MRYFASRYIREFLGADALKHTIIMVVLELAVATAIMAAYFEVHKWYMKKFSTSGKHHILKYDDAYVVPGGDCVHYGHQ
jgi:hypothetical protein